MLLPSGDHEGNSSCPESVTRVLTPRLRCTPVPLQVPEWSANRKLKRMRSDSTRVRHFEPFSTVFVRSSSWNQYCVKAEWQRVCGVHGGTPGLVAPPPAVC